MQKTTYQTPELRDANDDVIQQGAFGKNTALSNATNDGWIDYVMNNLEALHDTIGDSSASLDANGHVVEPANLAIGDEDGNRIKTNYLKLSGGTVSGTLNVQQNFRMQDNQENVFGGMYVPASSAASQFFRLYGGTAHDAGGATLTMNGAGNGQFTLSAKSANGSSSYDLVGTNGGALQWRGYDIPWDKDCVKLTGNQTVAGTKTFSSSPVVPTPSDSDNSTKAATTAFVENSFLGKLITKLASNAAVSISSLNTSSVFYRLLSWALTASGVQYNLSNSSAWYICLGALFGNLIIQGGNFLTYDTDTYTQHAVNSNGNPYTQTLYEISKEISLPLTPSNGVYTVLCMPFTFGNSGTVDVTSTQIANLLASFFIKIRIPRYIAVGTNRYWWVAFCK